MAHRARHRYAALLRRIEEGRMIKSDKTPEGQQRWAAAEAEREAVARMPHVRMFDKDLNPVNVNQPIIHA